MKRGRELASKLVGLPCLSGFLASIIPTSPPPSYVWKETADCIYFHSCHLFFFLLFGLPSPFWADEKERCPRARVPLRSFRDIATVNKSVRVGVRVVKTALRFSGHANKSNLTCIAQCCHCVPQHTNTGNFHSAQWNPMWLISNGNHRVKHLAVRNKTPHEKCVERKLPWRYPQRSGSCDPDPSTRSAESAFGRVAVIIECSMRSKVAL